jgi:type I restriction enzyme S subunit
MASDWPEVQLGEVITLQRGFDLPSQNRKPGKVPIVSSSGISDYHSEIGVKGPGVVTGRYGTIGQVFLIKEDYWPLNTTLWVKDFQGNDPQFVSYMLRTIDFHSCSDKSSVPGVNRNDLHQIPVLIPPLAEQKSIAAVLGTLDDKIELNRRMNATLEAMARALFQSWFVDFDPVRAKLDGRNPAALDPATAALFPDRFEDSAVGHIPHGWSIGTITDCCDRIHSGGTPRRDEPEFWDNGTIPWLTSGEVRQPMITATENFISELGLKESSAKWVPENSTVVALYGATAGQVSFLATAATTNQAICSLIPKTGFEFFNYFAMRGATADMESKAVGSAQQNISKGIVEETVVVLPSAVILTEFTMAAGPLFRRWIANIEQSRTLATLRDTLLPKLLSGELSVADVERSAGVAQA